MRHKIRTFFPLFALISIGALTPTSAWATSQILLPCVSSYNLMLTKTGAQRTEALKVCADRCGKLTAELRINAGLEENYQYCVSNAGGTTNTGAAQRCRDAQAKVNSANAAQEPQETWTACQADCELAKSEDVANVTTYTTIGASCTALITPVPQNQEDELQGDGAVADEDAEPTPPIADTGTPSDALPSMLQAAGLPNPAAEFSAGNRVGNVNFTGGIGGTGGGGSEAVSGGVGFQGNPPPLAPIDDRVRPSSANASNGGGGGGSGSGGGGGGGPMASGNMGGARPSGGNYPQGRPSVAGAQLQKMNPNSFWSGGGTSLAGGAPQRTTAATKAEKKVAEKKAKTPNYNFKGSGDGGLSRLFGNPNGSTVCGDSVFCPVEVRYQQFELLPNSDLKP